jgi:formylglycine-generating enzyme required for sulfatase activity
VVNGGTSGDFVTYSSVDSYSVRCRHSNDATLSNITVTEGALSPTFAAATFAYTVNVAYGVSTISVTGTATNSEARVAGNVVDTSLAVGSNTIKLTVTAPDGKTTNVYTVTVVRAAASTDATLSDITLNKGTLSPTPFVSSTTAYTVSVADTVSTISVAGTANHPEATVVGNVTDTSLVVGKNTITITVTAENGTTKIIYTVTVYRACSSVGNSSYTANGVSFDMVAVPCWITNLPTTSAGTGTAVVLSSFNIGMHEVTQGLWEAVMSTTPSSASGVGSNYPVYNVSWNDIVGTSGSIEYSAKGVDYYTNGFCYKLSQLVGGGKQFRLPTEAEWEYAAKGGQLTHNYTYSGSDSIGDVAWYPGNAGSTSHEVGTRAANELGIYDMSGNIYEWCSDWYSTGSYPFGTDNPTGPSAGTNRLLRGGGWYHAENFCGVAIRNNIVPTYIGRWYGFRLALP